MIYRRYLAGQGELKIRLFESQPILSVLFNFIIEIKKSGTFQNGGRVNGSYTDTLIGLN